VSTAPPSTGNDDQRWLRWALIAVVVVTAVRVAAVFATPLELYPDEAQYWLWAQTPAWGYASKPPMIAWLIAASTALGGDGEAWVRLPAALLHGATALVLFAAGRRLFEARTGLLACLLWLLTPAVALSSAFIATDAPFMLGMALSLWAYAALLDARSASARLLCALLLGAAVGLALLSKQAALYVLLGLVLHALIDREARSVWRGWAWLVALAAMVLAVSPNLVWQATHHFATFAHTAQVNAGLGSSHPLRPFGGLEFLAAQFAVLGPVPFAVLLGGAVIGARRRTLDRPDVMLLCMAIPPVASVTVFAFFKEAEANWAAAAYPASVVLVSAWLLRWRARRWIAATLVLQGVIAAVLAAALFAPPLVDAAGQSASLKRLRGWQRTAQFVGTQVEAQGPFTAVAVEDRSLFNELAYYGRGLFAGPGAPLLRMRPPEGQALNQAELVAPLGRAESRRVLVIALEGPEPARLPDEFDVRRTGWLWSVGLDRRHSRKAETWIASGYRGPVSSTRP
jgi:4-amino-4-deoxy-L-arabinose transferase-like glycosyltransferase